MKNPMQPIILDQNGMPRFRANKLVGALLDHGQKTGLGLNELARGEFGASEHADDWRQLAQLIGYSLRGFSELSYVDDATYDAAVAMHEGALTEEAARIAVLEEQLGAIRSGLREPVAKLFGEHPDDLMELP